MNYSLGFLKNFLRDEEGAELVEWIVFVALLVLGIAGAVAFLRSEIQSGYQRIGNCIKNTSSC
ncbi:Flp family type IVb pilin [Methylogaea oryzae]|uniref:Flp family type IVb pilin n=1 Tax=Methylogaea oryzae TaxID=1295382 RepID=UPI0006D055AA|nr:hypothetical protein [Methylogaea oryzae]